MSQLPPDGFSHALQNAMTRRQVGVQALADAVGVSRVTVRNYLEGRYLPRTKVVYRIAEALDSSRLIGIALRRRISACDYCGTTTIDNGGGGSARRWCNTTCRDRFRHGRTPRLSAERAAIARMCWDCEPAGTCYRSECPIRAFSPLPLAGDVITPLARQGRTWSPRRREAQTRRAG